MGYAICRMCCWRMDEKKQHLWFIVSNKMYILKNDNKRMWRRLSLVIIMPCLPIFTCENYWAMTKETFSKTKLIIMPWHRIEIHWSLVVVIRGKQLILTLWQHQCFERIGMMSTLIVIKIHSFPMHGMKHIA
jgi:hypothetical protein